MGIDIFFLTKNNEGEYVAPSSETIQVIADIMMGEHFDYLSWIPKYEAWDAVSHWNDDSSEQKYNDMMDNGGEWFSDLHNHAFPRRREHVALLCDLTDSRTPDGYVQEGETKDPDIIRLFLSRAYPGRASRLAQLIDMLYWR